MNALWVFLGGGLGALCRFGLVSAVTPLFETRFPLGILLCNLAGSFLLGLGMGYTQKSAPEWLSHALLIGFLGSFTTFSTFSYNTLQLFQDGAILLAFLNILGSLLLALALTWLGYQLVN